MQTIKRLAGEVRLSTPRRERRCSLVPASPEDRACDAHLVAVGRLRQFLEVAIKPADGVREPAAPTVQEGAVTAERGILRV